MNFIQLMDHLKENRFAWNYVRDIDNSDFLVSMNHKGKVTLHRLCEPLAYDEEGNIIEFLNYADEVQISKLQKKKQPIQVSFNLM